MNKPVILCVDDEQIVLTSLYEQLFAKFVEQYDIEIAESGDEAIELIEDLLSENRELVLTISDQRMPDMKGDALLIKIHELVPESKKILLTGLADKEAIINAVNGANLYRYIAKPWEGTDLVLTVKEALNAYNRIKEIENKNKELQVNNSVLVQINKELDTFLYKSSHDLKAPLATLKGLCNLGIAESDYHYFEKQDFIINQMHTLLNKVVKVGELKNCTLKSVPLNLQSIIKEMVLQLTREHGHVALDLQLEEVVFQGDEYVVHHALFHCIENAIQYSQIGTDVSKVTVKMWCENDTLNVVITNNGMLIPEEVKDHVFKMFVRGDNAYNGAGLGLYISRVAVDRLDGFINYQIDPKEQNQIVIRLPML